MSPFDLKEFQGYLTGYWLTDLANASAYFYKQLPNINWVGFYLSDGHKLRLGPFMGQPACIEIPYDKGVCGSAFTQRKTLLVDDVHKFPGHISCDANSRSELVTPFFIGESVVGVLDIDSPLVARFTDSDKKICEAAIQILGRQLKDKTTLNIEKALLEFERT